MKTRYQIFLILFAFGIIIYFNSLLPDEIELLIPVILLILITIKISKDSPEDFSLLDFLLSFRN